jgi:SAM-dependent methyltransferase
MRASILTDVTAPYGALEAFLYDLVIAPAVVALRAAVDEPLLRELPRGARVLEVGSGGGQLANDLALERPDLVVTGLDLSRAQVARAAKRARALGSRARFVAGSALALPFAGATFDAVVSVASIKHWPDRARGLGECVRVLQPGGALVVVEAERGCRPEDARAFVERWRMPALLRPLGVRMFLDRVAGPSLSLEDARALAAAQPLADVALERIAGTPGFLLRARRLSSAPLG